MSPSMPSVQSFNLDRLSMLKLWTDNQVRPPTALHILVLVSAAHITASASISHIHTPHLYNVF